MARVADKTNDCRTNKSGIEKDMGMGNIAVSFSLNSGHRLDDDVFPSKSSWLLGIEGKTLAGGGLLGKRMQFDSANETP